MPNYSGNKKMSPKFRKGDKVIYKDGKEYTVGEVMESTEKSVPNAYDLVGTLIVAREHELKKSRS